MARVKIKHSAPSQGARDKLLEVLGMNHVYIVRIIPLRDGYVVLLDDSEVDILFQNKCHNELRTNGFTAVMPPDLKAKRTILLFGVEESAYTHTTDEIKEEIERVNEYTAECIDAVFKFPSSRILKITFCNTAPAVKAQETGLKLFYTRVPSYQVKQEEYYPLKTCMRCYQVDDHVASQCLKPREHKVCSECAQVGHTWRECTSSLKKCLNCNGDHRTLAFKCPHRRAALERARETAKQQPRSYSQAAATTTRQQLPALPIFNPDTTQKIQTAMMYAFFTDATQPGTFEDTLNRILRRNGIAEIIIGEEPDSRKVLNLPPALPSNATADSPVDIPQLPSPSPPSSQPAPIITNPPMPSPSPAPTSPAPETASLSPPSPPPLEIITTPPSSPTKDPKPTHQEGKKAEAAQQKSKKADSPRKRSSKDQEDTTPATTSTHITNSNLVKSATLSLRNNLHSSTPANPNPRTTRHTKPK